MYPWQEPEPEQEEVPEVTWSEFTQLYLDHLKCVHVSEWDREEKPIVYTDVVPSTALAQLLIEQFCIQTNGVKEPESVELDEDEEAEPVEEEIETPNLPITLLTCFYIQTHKGTEFNCVLRYRSLYHSLHSYALYILITHIHNLMHTC